MLTQDDLQKLFQAQEDFKRATKGFEEVKSKFKVQIDNILSEYCPKKYFDFVEDFEVDGDSLRIDLGHWAGDRFDQFYIETVAIPLKVLLDSDYANRYKTYLELKKEFGK